MQTLKLSTRATNHGFKNRRSQAGIRRTVLAYSSAIAAAVVAPLTIPAAAATLTYNDATLGYGYFTINISSPTAISGAAGMIDLWTADGYVETWCVDVYDYLQTSGTFDIGTLTDDSAPISAGGPNPLSDAQIGQIGALVLNGDALVNAPPSGYTANDVAAAIQVAIWQVEYPTFSYSWTPPRPTPTLWLRSTTVMRQQALAIGRPTMESSHCTHSYNQTQIVDPSQP